MKRAAEERYREVIARARALLPALAEDRVLAIQALLERALGADRLDVRAIAELERLIEEPLP